MEQQDLAEQRWQAAAPGRHRSWLRAGCCLAPARRRRRSGLVSHVPTLLSSSTSAQAPRVWLAVGLWARSLQRWSRHSRCLLGQHTPRSASPHLARPPCRAALRSALADDRATFAPRVWHASRRQARARSPSLHHRCSTEQEVQCVYVYTCRNWHSCSAAERSELLRIEVRPGWAAGLGYVWACVTVRAVRFVCVCVTRLCVRACAARPHVLLEPYGGACRGGGGG